MEKIPQGRYTKEFCEEAARLVIKDGLSSGEAAKRLSLPKSTLENWVRSARRQTWRRRQKPTPSHQEAMRDIQTYIELFYNRQRKQKKLGYLSPAVYEQKYYKLRKAA